MRLSPKKLKLPINKPEYGEIIIKNGDKVVDRFPHEFFKVGSVWFIEHYYFTLEKPATHICIHYPDERWEVHDIAGAVGDSFEFHLKLKLRVLLAGCRVNRHVGCPGWDEVGISEFVCACECHA